MDIEVSLSVLGGDEPYTLIVEPWATEYEIYPNDKCALIAINPTQQPSFSVELYIGKCLVARVESGHTTYKFSRNGALEMEMPTATILLSGRT